MESNVSLKFTDFTPAAKIAFGNYVLECLNNNAAVFPNLPVSKEDLAHLHLQYTNAVVAAESGSKVSRAMLKNVTVSWLNAFKVTAAYVSSVAKGNEQVINEAGFAATKNTRQSAVLPGYCEDFSAFAPKAVRTILVSSKAAKIRGGYMFFAAPDGVAIEQTGNQIAITAGGITTYMSVCTRSKTKFENVASGKTMHLSMLAFNTAGTGPITNGQQVLPQ